MVLCRGSYHVVSYRTVLYSPRKYSINCGSYVLCSVSRTCMYSYCTVWGFPYVDLLYCIARGSYRVLSYCVVLCIGLNCAGFANMYFIVSLAVRVISYRIVLPKEIQYEPWIVCTVQDLPYMYVLYCMPIVRVSYHRLLWYPIVPYCTPRGNTVRTADLMYCAGLAVHECIRIVLCGLCRM
jgi:hypothetical protein